VTPFSEVTIDCEQGSDEWRMARLGLATASRFADVMATLKSGGEAATRRNYRTELVVERLTYKPTESFLSRPMQIGIEREPLARGEYEALMGCAVQEVGFVLHPEFECGASPDGLIGLNGGIELKCPTVGVHFDYLKLPAGECPSEYRWQVQGAMWLTGRLWWDFVSYCPEFPPELQLIRRRVLRDESAIDKLEAGVKAFMQEVRADEAFARGYVEPK